jgi:hypothetical protein
MPGLLIGREGPVFVPRSEVSPASVPFTQATAAEKVCRYSLLRRARSR